MGCRKVRDYSGFNKDMLVFLEQNITKFPFSFFFFSILIWNKRTFPNTGISSAAELHFPTNSTKILAQLVFRSGDLGQFIQTGSMLLELRLGMAGAIQSSPNACGIPDSDTTDSAEGEGKQSGDEARGVQEVSSLYRTKKA